MLRRRWFGRSPSPATPLSYPIPSRPTPAGRGLVVVGGKLAEPVEGLGAVQEADEDRHKGKAEDQELGEAHRRPGEALVGKRGEAVGAGGGGVERVLNPWQPGERDADGRADQPRGAKDGQPQAVWPEPAAWQRVDHRPPQAEAGVEEGDVLQVVDERVGGRVVEGGRPVPTPGDRRPEGKRKPRVGKH